MSAPACGGYWPRSSRFLGLGAGREDRVADAVLRGYISHRAQKREAAFARSKHAADWTKR